MTAPETGGGAGPSVVYLSVEGVVADLYRSHLPAGWTLAALHARDDEDEQLRLVATADAIIHTDVPITRRHLQVAARLRLVQRQGVGIDKLDVAALREHGTAVAICPDGTAEAVADHTLLLMLAAGRHLVQLHAAVTRRGMWPKWDYRDRSLGLQGAVVGIVGFGRIGQAVAQRVLVAGSDVLVHRGGGRPLDGQWPAGRVGVAASIEELFAAADVVSLHCPVVPGNRGFVDRRLLGLMKPEAIFVNTARGELVVEDDLVTALREGRIAAAGLDVLAVEPPAPDHPLFALPNVVLTPHLAAGTRQAQVIKARAVFENIRRVWHGEAPLHRVA